MFQYNRQLEILIQNEIEKYFKNVKNNRVKIFIE